MTSAGLLTIGVAAPPLMLRTQVVMDSQGLSEEAFRLLMPRDWRFDVGIQWDLSRSPIDVFTAYTVTSPEGSATFELHPHATLF